MNDAARAAIFRKPEDDNTPEGWKNLREAVDNVRSDLMATNSDRTGKTGKWAIRYPNGDLPHNEADILFMVNARPMVLRLMEHVEALKTFNDNDAKVYQAEIDDLSEGFNNETAALRAENSSLTTANENLQGLNNALGEEVARLMTELKKAQADSVAPVTEEERLQDIQDESDLNEAVERNAPIVAKIMADIAPANAAPKRKRAVKQTKAELPGETTEPPETAENALPVS